MASHPGEEKAIPWRRWLGLGAFSVAVSFFTVASICLSRQPNWTERVDAAMQAGKGDEAIAILNEQVTNDPMNPSLLHMRACVLFRLGKIEESLKDFDECVRRVPDSLPHDWQRGIALYYAGRYADGQAQFEEHRRVNPNDVENSVWHYLCVAKQKGHDEARKALIPSAGDARPPMMDILEMFRGTKTPEQILELVESAGQSGRSQAMARFYGYLYMGLYYHAHDKRDEARKYLQKSVDTKTGGYMGDVARVHLHRTAKP